MDSLTSQRVSVGNVDTLLRAFELVLRPHMDAARLKRLSDGLVAVVVTVYLQPGELRAASEVVRVVMEPGAADTAGVGVQGDLRSGVQPEITAGGCYSGGVVESAGRIRQVQGGERIFEEQTEQTGAFGLVGSAGQETFLGI